MTTTTPINADDDARQRLCLDMLRTWETYKTDGKCLTMEEADIWLAKLENGDDAEITL